MKKFIIILVVAITAILFWSPWLDEDGGEAIIQDLIREIPQQEEVKAEYDQLLEKYSYNSETGEGCDGLSTKWAPFGRTIQYCEYGSWYVTFWGQRF
ncbi:MAG: hypothetical protein UU46_C0012G0002 [Candidatus Uhrbacteria bacterium GW2011_GWD1_41_16]|uniref:Uncharacterized protein n=1 Tax=Candidatus Uhrbacteria bacterium GW2011_GWC1_41_20 TaxID=1618983 RepID=A0A0G0YF68_9BACT|nr:MAG: hypothetical protein UT52_C0018G0009 [Candidatus Uhrbacteria bacterium GW2011_GWE1_39_46]KKR63284.1 MAG: hypothetical protein UU04_C0021G0007 [Candidatus Uhrbacteria bacterium GW2011_GWC2_40_450]KKR95849.1 MAG: hypothetical protein UU46_C0012G0002 [Candidatus Uhrbacteria bacterium GW2011_GWD1_41_16]KKR98982.1 MAG: hypothetical protein UU50_C0012G0030 [Candidatus Uhrbacteria bacterium GW2011_GWC1_41_20]KKS07228.1 MAG: hypothetical protein UU62_C0020G0031 [Candidatus Uhrbacteria bacterium